MSIPYVSMRGVPTNIGSPQTWEGASRFSLVMPTVVYVIFLLHLRFLVPHPNPYSSINSFHDLGAGL